VIFLTGATGFLGGLVLPKLIENGIPVKALSRNAQAPLPGVTWCQMPLRSIELPAQLTGCDTIIHMAAASPASDPEILNQVNVKGTVALLHAAHKAGVRRFLYISSLDAGIEPLSPYGKSKRLAEDFVRASTMEYCIFRPSILYGPGSRHPMSRVIDFAERFRFIPVVGAGKYLWEPLYAPDFVAGIMEWLSAPSDWPQLQIITGPEALSFKDIVLQIGAAIGKPVVDLNIPKPLWQLTALLPKSTPIRSMLHSACNKIAMPPPKDWIVRTGICDFPMGLYKTLHPSV
jgi:nucleoside-diphosphate-sugar epimerase